MKLPKTVYVRVEHEENDRDYLVTSESLDDAVEESGVTTVGTYQLVETRRYEKVAKLVERQKAG